MHEAGQDALIVRRPAGLYCPPGDFYIDPWRPVERAVLTHAHADHARAGSAHYLATAVSAGVLRARLGDITLQGLTYGETVEQRGVRISLHPAGHVLGSAQVRLAYRGRVWVASGDFYLRGEAGPGEAANPSCAPFEPVRCHTFITESTFGLPIYRWRPEAEVFAEIDAWWQANAALGRPSLLLGYSLGKAQRLLAGVDASIGPIAVHPTVEAINAAYRAAGVVLPATRPIESLPAAELGRALLVAPPSARAGTWSQPVAAAGPSVAFASGWMQLRSARRRPGLDRGFVLSDHADWPGLLRAIAASRAEQVIVTHGDEAVLLRWLREQGLHASRLATAYGQDEAAESSAPPGGTAPALRSPSDSEPAP